MRPIPPRALNRREFLAGLAATATLTACGGTNGDRPFGMGRLSSPTSSANPNDAPRLASNPFTLGIASGDPLADSVVLWTRLAPQPLAPGGMGGMPNRRVPVGWEVARDPELREVVARGVVEADPAFAHAVHVDLANLAPDRWYWYRFRTGEHTSAIGRTRTTPVPGSPQDRLRFAVASCQAYTNGYYTPYPHLVNEDIDLILFLGDYIYEGGQDGIVRDHDGPEVRTLDAYRNRYALYKTDPNLQAAHAAFPWVNTWDDHEVENNYADVFDSNDTPVPEFLDRRAAAYLAYYEHLPVRLGPPRGAHWDIYRSFTWGDLASIFVLDTRQYRSKQSCNESVTLLCPDRFDEDRTILGDAQEGWLLDGLGRSRTRWNVLAQQVVFGALDFGGYGFNADQWDGYYAARQRILDFVDAERIPNLVVLTGDIHSSWVYDLTRVPGDPTSPKVGTELVGTSISTIAAPVEIVRIAEQILVDSAPLIQYVNLRERGYMRCEVTPGSLTADFRLVETVFQPTAPIFTDTSWRIAAGTPGAVRI